MKAAVRTFLTLTSLLLPGGQVIAQAPPPDSQAAEVSWASEEGSQRLLGVSAPTVPLWQPIVENRAMTLEAPSGDAPPVPAWSDWSTEKKVLVVGGGILALVILGVVSIG